ncbi:long-chain fatty acid--CoA ligase [Microbacterium sp. APC 3898]|uniref:Long-chain fatty acid--CoA ligase n=1 Tax=Planococcus notacanthi TaxID=3035188 RepID=A0ABT7ZNF4_9BACL|nr:MULTISPECIES: long-chain fatty acid--CoA ligase [Terrabacteria group]MDN3428699.1 long-chain fatty acid--CoA ligase [Planococcus sp. APC 4016]MDN3500180.1 long-chain fatty acid--CoA ligase [Microbacterium sp. APC 3898]
MKTEQTWKSHYPKGISAEMKFSEKTMPQLLTETAEKIPDHIAIKFYQKEISYKELDLFSTLFASSLQQTGIHKNDRVAIMLPNCPQYIISYYGILKAGAIVTQINPMLLEKELSYLLNDSGAETIIVYEPLYPRIQEIAKDTALKNIIVVSFETKNQELDQASYFESFIGKGDGKVDSVAINPAEDIAVLQYTGGTTGLSKGAMLTHQNIAVNALQAQEFFKDEVTFGEESCLTVIPLFHVFAMTSAMNLSILNGSKNILLPRFDLEEVLETIKREQPTTFPGVPTMYIAIANHPKAKEYGIDSINVCNSGSAPMPLETMKEFENKTGAKILEGYGLSEASPVTHCNPPFAERKPGSIGIGFPSTEYKIVDLATGEEDMPTGEIGELIIRGPQVMKGYWNMPEETAHTLKNGWLFTGDIAKMDESGYVYIVDRKKDLIISSGYNVYPRDIEEVLYEHPAVQEAVAIGIADPYRGESVKAIVVKRQGADITEEQLIVWAKDKMAAYKVPRIIEFRDELPKTNVGKILRRALREEQN